MTADGLIIDSVPITEPSFVIGLTRLRLSLYHSNSSSTIPEVFSTDFWILVAWELIMDEYATFKKSETVRYT